MSRTSASQSFLRDVLEEAGVGGDGPFNAVVADKGEFVDGSAAIGGFDACDCGCLTDEVAAKNYDAVVFFN